MYVLFEIYVSLKFCLFLYFLKTVEWGTKGNFFTYTHEYVVIKNKVEALLRRRADNLIYL